MPVDRGGDAAGLQGFELVAHVFVAADGSPADHRYLRDLWHRCVGAFALDDAVVPHDADTPLPDEWPVEPPAIDDGDALLAVRAGRAPGVHQVAARRVHDVLCLSLVLAPKPADGWAPLEARWAQVQRPSTPGVLGSVRILQARLADPGAELDVAALASVVAAHSGTRGSGWRPGVLRDAPPLGPFAVWEAADGSADQPTWDGRADRRVVVLAPADRDAELSAWTWSRGDIRPTPFTLYLLHAAKVRYELRVRATSPVRALRRAVAETVQQLESLVPTVRVGGAAARTDAARTATERLARLRALEIRLQRVRAWLADLRATVQIAARNMAARAGPEPSAGLFADDRGVADWLDGQLERDRSYLAVALDLAGGVVASVAPLLPPPADSASAENASTEERLAEEGLARVPEDGGVALTGTQKRLLIDALSAAYPSYDELDLMLDTTLGRRLADYAAPDRLPIVLHKLLRSAGAQGWTAALVTGAALANPGNPQLRALIDSGQLDDDLAVRAALDDPSGPVRDLLPQAGILAGVGAELQHVVRIAAAFQNVVVFATTLLEVAGRVCWVEVLAGSGRSSGTGFLVGPDLVLTNHHVLAQVIAGRVPPTAVSCVFDYHIRADGTPDRGVAVGLAQEWLLAASPPSVVDEQPFPAGEPAADELDYALVRLAGRPGRARVAGGRMRGWLDLLAPPPTVTVGTPLLIVQHPDNHPQKLAVDTNGVLEVNKNGTRFRYGVNTSDGSSGSPCLNFDLALLGLHHSGTKDRTSKRNESIPIAAIVAHLRAQGHVDELG